jgi:hypothetical protein
MIEPNICGSFKKAGFEFDAGAEPYRIRSDEEKLRKTQAFQKIWSLNCPLEKLSARRRNVKFGWIYKTEEI